MTEIYELRYGSDKKVLAKVVPDTKYAKMWRIEWPDGTLSDMVNLSRAKDAARVLAMARYKQTIQRTSLLHWTQDRPQSGSGSGLVR